MLPHPLRSCILRLTFTLVARQRVNGAEPYQLILNNCQDFVHGLLGMIYDEVDPNMDLYRVRKPKHPGLDILIPDDYA